MLPPSTRAKPPAPPSSPETAPKHALWTTWVAAALLIVAMLSVPIGVLIFGRSLIPSLDLFKTSEAPSAAVDATESATAPEAVAIRGTVVDGDGNPVAGAAVRVVLPNPPYDLLEETKSGVTGKFSFAKTSVPDVRLIASRDPDGVVTSSEIHTVSGLTTDMELVLSVAETIRGIVVNEAGVPVSGVVLSVEKMPWATASAPSDAAGAFVLTTVPHEATELVAVARGFMTARVSLAARRASAAPAELVVRVTLVSAPPVEGDVSDPDGKPVRTSIVACEGEPSESRTTSGVDGAFELPPAVIGCAIYAQTDEYAPSAPVTAVLGHRVTLQLKAGGAIEGIVVDERGSSISSFTIGIESMVLPGGKNRRSGARRGVGGENGAFTLDKLGPGTYVLTAAASGKPPTRSDPIEVTGGATTRNVRIVLVAGGVVVGHVYDEEHAPIVGADLRFDQVSSVALSRATAKSDESGAYRLEGAPAGPFTVVAEKRGFRLRMIAGLEATSGATLTSDITLTRTDGGTSMELGGIGATVDQTREGILFRTIFPGDPADKAGLHGGDVVIRIDGESTEDMSVADALQRLRGQPGTTVGVSVKRVNVGGEPETFDAVVVRAVVVH